jgi:hypothetical protein
MREYHNSEKATAGLGEESLAQGNPSYPRAREPPAYMSLAAQYGLSDDMDIGRPAGNEPTIEQEYQAYVTAPPSPKDVDLLKFWEVSDNIDGA